MNRPPLEFLIHQAASQGARPYQEDSIRFRRLRELDTPEEVQPVIAVLADGMGGHVAGEVASATACARFIEVFETATGSFDDRLDLALAASNDALKQAILENGALNGMGCTLIAGHVNQNGLRFASVGDSMILHYRNRELVRLNDDHSFGAYLDQQVARKQISASEALNNPRRRTLRSALTGAPIPIKQISRRIALEPGDWVLLASDGLETLSGTEIATILQRGAEATPEHMAKLILRAVDDRRVQHQDNTSLIAIRVVDPSDQPTRIVQKSPEMDLPGGQPLTAGEFVQAQASSLRTALILGATALAGLGIAAYMISRVPSPTLDRSTHAPVNTTDDVKPDGTSNRQQEVDRAPDETPAANPQADTEGATQQPPSNEARKPVGGNGAKKPPKRSESLQKPHPRNPTAADQPGKPTAVESSRDAGASPAPPAPTVRGSADNPPAAGTPNSNAAEPISPEPGTPSSSTSTEPEPRTDPKIKLPSHEKKNGAAQ